ncbi:MAG TPA: hypothetical protein VIR38_06035, partial [Thalassobaculum sp.]
RYLDFTNLVSEIYRDSPRAFERHEVGIAFEIIRETRTDSGAQCVAIEQMIKDEATPFWSHAIRTAGPARVVGGLLVTVASGIDAFASGSLISIAIASAGFGTSLWGLAPIRRGAVRIATAERDLELYETYVGKSEAARDRMIEIGYSET